MCCTFITNKEKKLCFPSKQNQAQMINNAGLLRFLREEFLEFYDPVQDLLGCPFSRSNPSLH